MPITSSHTEAPTHGLIPSSWKVWLQGLDQSIVEKVDLQPYWEFKDVCKLGIKVVKYAKNKQPYISSYSWPNPPPKPFFAPKHEHPTKGDQTRDKGKGIARNSLSNLMARGVSGVKGTTISKLSWRALTIKEIKVID